MKIYLLFSLAAIAVGAGLAAFEPDDLIAADATIAPVAATELALPSEVSEKSVFASAAPQPH